MPKQDGPKKLEIPYKFRSMDLAALKPHPKQAEIREISDDALKRLDSFIDEVGLVEEILINKRSGHIISGHQRRRVLLAQGFEIAKIKVVDVTRKVEDMMFINLNSQAISGNFTAGAVEFVMSLEAKLGSDQYQKVGLQALQVELSGNPKKKKPSKNDPDNIPELSKKAVSKPGDIYQLGNHRLLCGDALKKKNIEKLTDGQKINMIFADPPFDMKIDPIFIIYEYMKEIAPGQFWMGSDKQLVQLSRKFFKDFRHFFVHDFRCATLLSNNMPGSVHTLIAFMGKLKMRNLHDGWSTIVRVATLRASKEHAIHTQAKATSLVFEFVIHYTDEEDVVLDPFAGSGTTIMACELASRSCLSIEMDPLFCDLIVKRWEEYTGLKSKRIRRA
jgi:16S rRNA G966 N2-methylase RsmD